MTLWGKLGSALAVLIAAVLAGYHYGAKDVQVQWDKEKSKTALATAQQETAQAKVTTRVVTQYVDRVKVVHERGEKITKEVPIYVPSATTCDLPGGFRVLHDAAAQGVLPDASRIADAATVPAQDAAAVIVENYNAYHALAEQLMALQDWVKKQQEQAQ
jgi:hypothetical protein